MILIYTQQESPRLRYVLKVFSNLAGVEFQSTTSQETFNQRSGAKILYSDRDEDSVFNISPSHLLIEQGWTRKTILKDNAWYGLPALIIDGDSGFDPFAMSFYLLSRYEEYDGFKPDVHNRFPAEESCLYEHDLLEKPLINLWVQRLIEIIEDRFGKVDRKPPTFEFKSTIDIDQAWKFKQKGLTRTLLSAGKDFINRDLSHLRQRIEVLSDRRRDPFFNYDWQTDIHEKYQVQVNYFVQVGPYGKFDKNISPAKKSFQRLIRQLDTEHIVGMHPSYQSNKNPGLIESEKDRLEEILERKITTSRQHYLMHSMPETYERLIKLGITEDYTMGYSTHIGFRAGIASPFPFYNLSKEESTNLTLVPFCYMDITPLHYRQETVQEAQESFDNLLWEVRRVGGTLSTLWHNESLSEDGRWKGWRRLYEYVLGVV